MSATTISAPVPHPRAAAARWARLDRPGPWTGPVTVAALTLLAAAVAAVAGWSSWVAPLRGGGALAVLTLDVAISARLVARRVTQRRRERHGGRPTPPLWTLSPIAVLVAGAGLCGLLFDELGAAWLAGIAATTLILALVQRWRRAAGWSRYLRCCAQHRAHNPAAP